MHRRISGSMRTRHEFSDLSEVRPSSANARGKLVEFAKRLIIKEDWQVSPLAKDAPGAAVRTMAEAGQDPGIPGLVERADILVLPWDESPWPRLQEAVANRGQDRPANRTGEWSKLVREHCDRLRAGREAARRREGEDRRKAFIEAARTGDLPMFRKLLEAGVDINARSRDRWTARELAERHGKREAERLLERASATRTPTPHDGRFPSW